ncbi:MAG: hypothetical protein A2W00_12795 [Candidatus Eisenbacteria bacterium RBG_16_71_46]|nr:MAG: hypothetical protein A2W00_12795 [Candidatus Eisenbacteria bacterium RBG_16_71_46]OGF23105.1 MAG: hypothetical protein A2V63_04015 [Candidatus Eisenbacteria bacterium RBG_19FT_COMBO_70_11]
MEIHDRRFACERGLANRWRAYDSIECLMRDVAKRPGGDVWLADYDSGTLHAADSLWIAHGEFPSPMGAGYAAFLDAASAREVAITSKGTVGRLDDFLAAARGATP